MGFCPPSQHARRPMLRCNKSLRPAENEDDRARPALDLPHLCGPLDGRGIEPALSRQSREGPDRPLGRLRSADPDRLRRRSSARQGRGRQGRRADLASGRHARVARGHSPRDHEHVDDDQRDGRLAVGALCGARRRARRVARQAPGHDPERHHQGISLARHLRFSAGALHAAHQGRRAVRRARNAQMESDERLLLSFAGSGRDAGAGTRLRARHRHRDPRHRAGVRPGEGRGVRGGGRPHLLLRQCRHPHRHRALQDARLHRAVGGDHPRALRREKREAPPLPLRRSGELARAHRAAAREQRASHLARNAFGRAVEERARPRRAAPGLERGARPAQALGPAMVDPHAADRGLRDGSARNTATCSTARR